MVSLFKGAGARGAKLLALITFTLCFCFKISPIIGSRFSFFSLADSLTPLAGADGLSLLFGAFFSRMIISQGIFSIPLKVLLYRMPGFFASLAWAYPGKILWVGLPAACMVAFIVHPIGMFVIPYTFYWLIPIAIYFSGRRTIFLQSLATTFVAHAVGSVVWLYMKEIPAIMWWNLIPVVAAERLFNALVMTGVYYVVVQLISVDWKKSFAFRRYLQKEGR